MAKKEKKENQEIKESKKVKEPKEPKEKKTAKDRSSLLLWLIVAMAAAIVMVIIVICAMHSWLVSEPKKLAKQTANIYAFGDGENMAELIAPGYVAEFEKDENSLTVSSVQDTYIEKFRSYVNDEIGNIADIECKVTNVMAVSNISDFTDKFESYGVSGVSEYRRISAQWTLTGENGETLTMDIEECVLKCDDGWYVDYVQLPEQVGDAQTDAETTEETDGDTDDAGNDAATTEETETDDGAAASDDATTDDTETTGDSVASTEE